jgi:DNA-binding response OmpR family regulator
MQRAAPYIAPASFYTPSCRRYKALLLKKLTIVLVDDDADVLESVAACFHRLGHDVIPFSNALRALDHLHAGACDLLVADIKLREMSGLDLISQVRARHPLMAIVAMTGHEEEYPLSMALKAGADAYLAKPFSLKTLELMLQQTFWETASRLDWWEHHSVSNC